MDTSRPRNDSFGYNESNSQQKSLFYDKQNVLDSIIDDYIKQFEIETDYKFSRKYSYDVESSVVFRQKNVFPQFRTNYNFSRKYSNDVESSVTFNYRQKNGFHIDKSDEKCIITTIPISPGKMTISGCGSCHLLFSGNKTFINELLQYEALL